MAQSLQIPVEINLKTNKEDFDKITNKIKNTKAEIGITVTSADLKAIRSKIQGILSKVINVPVGVNERSLKQAQERVSSINAAPVRISVEVDESSLNSARSAINSVSDSYSSNAFNRLLGGSGLSSFSRLFGSSNGLLSSITRMGSSLGLVGSGFSAATRLGSTFFRTIGTLAQATVGLFTKVVNGIKKIATTIGGSINNIKSKFNILNSTLAKGLSLAALTALSKKCLELSSDLIEVQNVVDTTFGKSSNVINDFAESALKNFGLTELQAKKYASTLGAIAKASGESDEATLQMSTSLTKLTADVASFFNYDYDTAFNKIRSGLTGETEPLKDLGVVMTVANLEQYRLAQGIKTAYSEMSSAEQMALRYNYIMQALTDTQGDFNKTQASWANQLRVLQGQAQQLGAILGNLLQKVLYPVLTVVNAILSRAVAMGNVLAKAFGFDTKTITDSQSGTSEESSPSVATATDKEAKSQDNLAKSTKKATAEKKKQNKEREKELSSVHKLNILNKKQAESAKASTGTKKSSKPNTAGTSVGGLGFDLLDYADVIDKGAEETETAFEKFINKMKDLASKGDFEGIGASLAEQIDGLVEKINFEKVEEKLIDFITKISRVINGFVAKLDTGLIGEKLGGFFNTIVHTVNAFYDTIDFKEIGTKIADGFNGLFEGVDWAGLGVFLLNKINSVFQTLAGFVTTFDWLSFGGDLSEMINSAFDSIDFESIETTVTEGINGLTTTIGEILWGTDWGEKGEKFGSSFAEIIKGIKWDEIGTNLGKALSDLLDFAVSFLEQLINGDSLNGIVDGIKNFFGTFFDEVKNKDLPKRIQDLVNNAFKKLNSFLDEIPWKDIYTKIHDFISGLDWLGILGSIAKILLGGLSILINAALSLVTSIFTQVIKAVGDWMIKIGDKIVDTFTNAFEKVKTMIKDTINNIKTGIIDTLNNIPGVDLPGGSTSSGGGHSFASNSQDTPIVYSSAISVPHLAKGAVIPPNNKFLAMLGDQTSGTNIETPLSTMIQAFKSALSDSNYSGMGDIYIPIYVNNELTSEELIRKQEIERYRSNGKH